MIAAPASAEQLRVAVSAGVARLAGVVAVADQKAALDARRGVAEDDVGGEVGRLRQPLADPALRLDLELLALEVLAASPRRRGRRCRRPGAPRSCSSCSAAPSES